MIRTCIQCGSEKYYCKGLCKRCYSKQFVPSRWSEKSDFCVRCGASEAPHVAHGLCSRCYSTRDSSALCACGCGNKVKSHRGKTRRFIHGHWLRTQGKGSDFQRIHRDKLSGKNNPQYGKFGKDHPAYGHKTKPEVRELRRQVAIKRVASQKKSKTDIEIILSEMLDDMGIEHDPQCPIKGKFVVDEFLPKHNIIIEANGDYWHGHPTKFPVLNKTQQRNADRDMSKFKYLSKCGYIVVYFWEQDLKHHQEYCRRRITELTKYTVIPFIQDSV